MKQGFVKVAAVTPKIKVADTAYNGKLICSAEDSFAKNDIICMFLLHDWSFAQQINILKYTKRYIDRNAFAAANDNVEY